MQPTKYIVHHADQTLSLTEWAELLSVPYNTLHKRYKAGLRPPQLFARNATKLADTPITYQGQTQSLRHWAKEVKLPYSVIKMRFVRGMQPPELFKPKRLPRIDIPQTPAQIQITYLGKTHTLFEWSRILKIGFDTLHKRYTAGERNPEVLLKTP
jgi:hypothetical protein